MADWQNRIVGHEDVDPKTLVPNPANWRTHPKAQRNAMGGALEEIGWVQSVIVNKRSGRIVDGHLRVDLAISEGAESVPVVYVDLSDEEERLALAVIDPIGAMAGRNKELFESLTANLVVDNSALLSLLGRSGGGETDPDEVPAIPVDPVSKRGDVWLLGAHRIMCGDSTNPDDVRKLMNGEKAKLMATDPPYLVDYKADNHPQDYNRGKQAKQTANKEWDDYVDPTSSVEFFAAFLKLGLEYLEPNSAVYQWHADLRRTLVAEAWERAGLLQHQVIQWVKTRPVLTRSHYMWQHEPCLYGWVKGSGPTKKPPSNAKTVWEISTAGEEDGIHPTQKPVEIFLRPLEYHLEIGELCYEPFSGSGTCIIAAEKLQRRCYAMELSPQFVDVAVRRWEEFTGKKAIRA